MPSHSPSGHDPIWPEFSPCFPHSELALYQILRHINTRDEQALKYKEIQESHKKADNDALKFASDLGLPLGNDDVDTIKKLKRESGPKNTWEDFRGTLAPKALNTARKLWLLKHHTDKGGTQEEQLEMDDRQDAFIDWLVGNKQGSSDMSLYHSNWTAKGDNAMVEANKWLSVRDTMEKEMHKNICNNDAKLYILEAKTQYYAQKDFYLCFERKKGLVCALEKKIKSLEAVLVKCYPNPGFICPSVGASSLVDCELDWEERLLGVLLGGRRVS